MKHSLLLLLAIPMLLGAQTSEQCTDSTYKQDGYCPAVLSSAAVADPGETTADVTFQMDEGDGTNYACATGSATPPATGNLLVACVGGIGADPVASVGSGTQTVPVAGLTAGSSYYVHAVNYSPNGWFSNIVTTAQITMDSATVPGQVTGFALGTPSSSSIPASWTAVADAATYEIYTSGDVLQVDGLTGTSTTITGLSAETAYTFKARARNAAGAGTFSATDTATTAASGTATPYYSTDFETGMVEENGVTWSGSRVPQADGIAYSGTYALRFRYGPTALGTFDSAQQDFTIASSDATAPDEVWIEYMMYIPANWVMRSDGHNYNNKLFALHAGNYSTGHHTESGDTQAVFEYTRVTGGSATANIRVLCIVRTGGCDGDSIKNNPIFSSSHLGQWVRIRFHLKVGTTGNAIVDLWRDDTLVSTNHVADLWFPSGDNHWRVGYLMGTANTGHTEETDFYIDDFKVYDTDPGW